MGTEAAIEGGRGVSTQQGGRGLNPTKLIRKWTLSERVEGGGSEALLPPVAISVFLGPLALEGQSARQGQVAVSVPLVAVGAVEAGPSQHCVVR